MYLIKHVYRHFVAEENSNKNDNKKTNFTIQSLIHGYTNVCS